MKYQFYWKSWHFGKEKVLIQDFNIFDNYIFIGPLQIRYWSSK